MTPQTHKRSAQYSAASIAIVLAIFLGYLLSVSNGFTLAALVALSSGIFVAGVAFYSPRLGFYALLISSMLGRFEIPIVWESSLRPDQLVLLPVLVGVAIRLSTTLPLRSFWSARLSRVSTTVIFAFVGLALYLAVNALSSFLFSPQPWQSYKIVLWLVLSFLAFSATYFVVGRYVGLREALLAILASGFISAAVGIFFFLLFLYTGSTFGVQQDPNPKAYGTFFEANIFGSFQAFSSIGGIVLLHLGQVRGRAAGWVAIGTTLSIVALALSFTRAAWLGFLTALLVLIFFQLRGGRFLVLILRLVMIAFGFSLILAPIGLFPALLARFASIGETSGSVEIRREDAQTALAEWPSSPILGLGTNSYGQRHLDPTQDYAADYLGNLFLTVLYDTGLVGLLILLVVFGIIGGALIRIVRNSKSSWQSASALALLCGLAAWLVAYNSTNAFWFSYNWVILAVAVRLSQSFYQSQSKYKKLPSLGRIGRV